MNARRLRGVTSVGVLVVVTLVVGLVWFPRSVATTTASEVSESAIPDSSSTLLQSLSGSPVADSTTEQPTSSRANPDPAFIAPKVEAEIAAEGSTTVIVRLDTTLSGDDQKRRESAKAAAGELLDTLPEESWSQVNETGTVPVVTFTVNAAGLEVLRQSELVDSVAANERKFPTSVTSSTFVGARSAWGSEWTGAGSTIAVLDSGVQTNHPYLMTNGVPKTIAEACFSTPGGGYVSACPSPTNGQQFGVGAATPCSVASQCSHGTHVAGIAVGGDAGASNPQGVAPGASLIAVQVFAESGTTIGASDSDINDALQWLYDEYQLGTYPGLVAVNLSLGDETKYTSYCNYASQRPYIQQLLSVGIATVVASGNDGWIDGVASPGCVQEAVTVGAQNDAGAALGAAVNVATYSNIGPQVDFLAPGSSISSSIPGSAFEFMSGTSMATPAVAGAFALIRDATSCDLLAQLRNDTNFTTFGSNVIPGLRLDKAVRGTPCEPQSVTPNRGAGVVQVAWQAPIHPGSSAIIGYEVTAFPGGATCTTNGALTCAVANPAPQYMHAYTVRARNAAGFGIGATAVDGGTQFTPMNPRRVLDTRPGETTADGLFAGGGAIGPQATRTTPISGRVGIPADAVAVVLNVTVADPTAWSNLRAFPAGVPVPPEVSNLNYLAGQTVPNLVVVKLGAGGAMSLFNAAGFTQVAVDAMGYYRDSAGSKFTSMAPARFLDTRVPPVGEGTIDGQSSGGGRIGISGIRNVQIAGRAGVPADATAVVVNVAAIDPTAWSNLRIFPAGTSVPDTSNLNYLAGQTVPNLVVVKLGVGGIGVGGAISLYNELGTTDVIADVMGYYRGGSGTMFTPLMPVRLLDSRPGYSTFDGAFSGIGRIGANSTKNVQIAGRGGVPMDATAVVLNLTAVDPSAWSNLLAYPTGTVKPLASNLNYSAGQTVPNLVIVKIGSLGRISLFNEAGTTDVVADVMGYYR